MQTITINAAPKNFGAARPGALRRLLKATLAVLDCLVASHLPDGRPVPPPEWFRHPPY